MREIGKRFRIKSTKTVSDLLHSLARKGYIERDPSRSRGVQLLGYQGSRRTQPVPFYGKIARGRSVLLPEHRKGSSRWTAASSRRTMCSCSRSRATA